MEKKIKKSIIHVSVLVALITYLFSSISLYMTMMFSLDQEVKEIAEQISVLLSENKEALQSLSVFSESRITMMNEDGTVLFDSRKDSSMMENHMNRPEIIEAFQKGEGRSLRFSESLESQTYNYAVKLTNGIVLRISSETQSLYAIMISGILVTGCAMIVIVLIAILYSRKLTKTIIRPINQMDFNHPLSNHIYPEIRPLLENLDRHEKMRKEFSANVSHELKTPLTSISGYAEIMSNGLVKEEDIPLFSSKIYTESQNLFHKIDDIIRISKLDEAHLIDTMEVVDYSQVIESVLDHLSQKIQEKHLSITKKTKSVTGLSILSVIEEILYNLIENAVKYNKDYGNILIVLDEDDDGIHIQIQDTGIGISEHDLPRIYERFFRSDKSHSQTIEGSGLGLSIVKHGIALLNGEIHVQSQIGKGTTFTIQLKK